MNANLKQASEKIIPFLVLGIASVTLFGMFILFSYLLFWGLIIGMALWLLSFIKPFLFPKKMSNLPTVHKGRTIEHNDID